MKYFNLLVVIMIMIYIVYSYYTENEWKEYKVEHGCVIIEVFEDYNEYICDGKKVRH
jgi:hypothetical protein